MSNTAFTYNDLRHFVRLFLDMKDIDIGFMVPGHEAVTQVTREHVESVLAAEDELNAEEMITYWLMLDKALEAIGMRESKGYMTEGQGVEGFYNKLQEYAKAASPKKAYIAIAKANAKRAEGHIMDVPLNIEMVAKNGDDAELIHDLNEYRDEIFDQNNWDYEYPAALSDAIDFGCGAYFKGITDEQGGIDTAFLEARALQGQPLTAEEYLELERHEKRHILKHVPIFELIMDRRAKGEAGMFFESKKHTMLTRMETISLTEARQRWPEYAEQMKEGLSSVQTRTNPEAYFRNGNEQMTTLKTTWVQMPVSFTLKLNVETADGVVVMERPHSRMAIVEFTRVEGAGIVDMEIDKYAHHTIPLVKVVREPSKHHAYGIGIYRDTFSAEWAFNLAYNGKFNWWKKMSQTRVFYKRGAVSQDVLDTAGDVTYIELADEGAMMERPISELVYTEPPLPIPSMYRDVEASSEQLVDRTSGWPAHSGMAVGNSGRQQALMTNSSEVGQRGFIKNIESCLKPLADKFYSDIVQFDSDREIRFTRPGSLGSERKEIVLNEQIGGEYIEVDPTTHEERVFTYMVRNGFKNLTYSTRIVTRPFIPSNPTELRFWLQDHAASIFPLLSDPTSLEYFKWQNETIYGGIFSDMITRIEERFAAQEQQQQMQYLMELQRAMERDEAQDMKDKAAMMQDDFRLREKAKSDLIKSHAALLTAMAGGSS